MDETNSMNTALFASKLRDDLELLHLKLHVLEFQIREYGVDRALRLSDLADDVQTIMEQIPDCLVEASVTNVS